MADNRQKSNERLAAYAIGLVAIVAVVIGVWQIYSNFTGPFQIPESNTNIVILSEADEEKLFFTELQGTDTDGDGLSDFDELYVYETSPYLADSDSDDKSDKEEIEAGANPNCPEGEDCGVYTPSNINVDEFANANIDTSNLNSSISAAEVREVLKNAGAPSELVDALSDEEVIELYYQTVEETGVNPLENGNASIQNTNGVYGNFLPESGEYSYDDLRNLSADEIRFLLESTGADMELMNQLSDEAIVSIFQQALDEQILLESQNQNLNINQ